MRPLGSLAIACAIGVAALYPEALIYDRAHGAEFWRYLTASLVHYDSPHLWTNLAAFCLLAVWLERVTSSRFLFALAVAVALLATLVLHLLLPEYVRFAGVSAVNYALLAALAGSGRMPYGRRVIGIAVAYQLWIALRAGGPPMDVVQPVWQLHLLALALGWGSAAARIDMGRRGGLRGVGAPVTQRQHRVPTTRAGGVRQPGA
ncbi:MAG: rhomboid family intramembrane serine protease [Pseudomonadales bacterium]